MKGNFDIVYRDFYLNFWGTKKEDLESAKCYQTWMFTIIDNGLKIEILKVEYSIISYIYMTSGAYRRLSDSRNINSLYPITKSDPKEWRGRLSILQKTSWEFHNIYASLKEYVSSYSRDYGFLDK